MPSLSVAARNAMLNALIATIGASPTVELRTGDAPDLDSEDTGTLLATFALGASWATAAAAGSVNLANVPMTADVVATGLAGHFRLKSSGGTAHISGTVSAESGEGDLRLDTPELFMASFVTITSWYLNTSA